MAEPFLTPEQRRDKARGDFVNQYKEQLAVTLKTPWDKEKMELLGYDNPKPPSNEQFKEWADELINTGGFMIYDRMGKPVKRVDIEMMQKSLSPEKKGELLKEFGTDQLREVILNRDQLNSAGEQVGQATFNHSGRIPLLGGASIIDAIMGFFEWMFSGFPRGKDGGIFSGLKESIAKRAVNGVGNDVDNLLARNVPTINPGVRKFIAGKVREGGEEAVLGTPKPGRTLDSTEVGEDVKPSLPPASDMVPPAPVKTTGNPEADIPARFEEVVKATLAAKRITMDDIKANSPEAEGIFKKAVDTFKAEGTKLALSAEGKALSKSDFAKTLIENTRKKLIAGGMDASKLDDPAMKKILEEMQRQIERDYDNIKLAAEGKSSEIKVRPAEGPAPTAPAPGPSLAAELVPEELMKSLTDPKNREQFNLIAGAPLSDDNLKAVRDAVAPVLIKHADGKNADLIGKGSKAYDALAQEIFSELEKKQAQINPAGGQIGKPELIVLSKKMAKEYIAKEVNKAEVKIPPDKDFEDRLKLDEFKLTQRIVDTMKQQKKGALAADIKGTLVEEIKSSAMGELTGDRNAGSASPRQLLDLAYNKGKIGWFTKKAGQQAYLVDRTRDDALTIARRTGMAPNEAQTDLMGNIVADAVIDVSTKTDFKGDQAAFQAAVQAEVSARLRANKGNIDANGNSFEKGKSTARAVWRHGSSLTWQQYSDTSLNREAFAIDDATINEAARKAAEVAGKRFQTEVAPLQDKVRGKGVFKGEMLVVKADMTPGAPPREVVATR